MHPSPCKGSPARCKRAGWGSLGGDMSEILRRIVTLVLAGDYLMSDHGYDELGEDDILLDDAIGEIAAAVAIEDYPDRVRRPSVWF